MNLIEARTLLAVNDLSGRNTEDLVVFLNVPIEEARAALISLADRGLVVQTDEGFLVTEAGHLKVDECWEVAERHAQKTFADFTDAEVNTFTDVLKRLIDR